MLPAPPHSSPHRSSAHTDRSSAHPDLPDLVRPALRQKLSTHHERRAVDVDWVAHEEPLEIRVNGFSLAVVMRTPGNDRELVMGFLVSELIARPEEIEHVRHCDQGDASDNLMLVTLRSSSLFDPKRFARNMFTSSSCGICGKRSLEQALRAAPPLSQAQPFQLPALTQILGQIREQQPGFRACGGLHAAGMMGSEGQLLVVHEDIGRHNAVDKVIGWGVARGSDFEGCALFISGRASFEMVQKALAARIGTLVAVGGVSSLALALASRAHINLLGFASERGLNLYTDPDHE